MGNLQDVFWRYRVECVEDVDTAVYQDALAIRFSVFVEEQGVDPDVEVDAFENQCVHYVLYDEQGLPVATARLLVKSAELAKIQRVAVVRSARKMGLGAQIMRAVLAEVRSLGVSRVILGAQLQALAFYQKLGFEVCGKDYLDAGIVHRDMQKVLR